MCVSYRKPNSITKAFEYLIPKVDNYVIVFMTGSSIVWIITVDARRGYHQILVLKTEREKLVLFVPDHKKSLKVGPFGSKNAPPFSTFMMGEL